MLRKILVLTLGTALGAGGAQASGPVLALKASPVIGAELTLVGHRHAQRHDRHTYNRGARHARPVYRGRGYHRHRHGHAREHYRGYYRGYHHGYQGRHPGYGRQFFYQSGPDRHAWRDYLRHLQGK